jgi:hypothetical protein
MNLEVIRRTAMTHKAMEWTGFVMNTEDVLEMIGAIEGAQRAAQRGIRALLDHDLEMTRNCLRQIAGTGDEGAVGAGCAVPGV